ncbi:MULTISPECIES: GFA family protein [unclassified Bradyrhizobium]|uniref:GFA family protein n=1 Tax=unclassified Bradyrhizobium TaxID=2631580 RepID=UPI0004BA0165|nr:hypothetical protein [Bradyrhizobium sp. URHA0013]
MPLTGGCHCGAIRYEVNGDMMVHALCHCADCRRHSGAPMVGWAMYSLKAVKVVRVSRRSINHPNMDDVTSVPIAALGCSTATKT